MKFIKSFVLLLFIGVVVIFIIQNLELVVLNFVVWKAELSLSIVSLSFYILGALSGGIVFSMLKKLSSNSSKKDTNY
ncbi:lipopolysaccharide assembly protein LapA domain-containing protein [Cyclobacterium salsum]|uniref:lipopolysaccharide assembly protein LapA domain-containing protein n=1 Tax=Cyclobacterium salsum TaxID=2666329 RepID=UPI001391CDEC